jgi:hypothetical protein
MRLLQLTALESGTPCYIPPDNVGLISTGTKLRAAADVVIGQDNRVVFTVILLKHGGGNVSVRETPEQVVNQLNQW